MNPPLHILMVEDAEDDATLLRFTLQHGGYAVTSQRVDTPAAMRAAIENQSWDVITSDHSMPHFSAPAALALAKEVCPEVPFIILSGEIDLNLAVSLMRGGAKDYIQKTELLRVLPAIERELREAQLRRERLRMDAELARSDQRFQEVLENSLDAAYNRNLRANTYEYLSPVFTRIAGYTPEEMATIPIETILSLIHPDDLAETQRVMTEAVSGTIGTAYQVEYRFKHKKGHYHWLQDKFTLIRDTDGQPQAFIGSVSDITERKRMEIALRDEDHLVKQMVTFAEELLRTGPDQVSFQKIIENLIQLSKAKYGFLTVQNENTGKFTTVAAVGLSEQLKLVTKILGFEIIGKVWNDYAVENDQLKGQIVSHFASLNELAGRVVPEILSKTIAKLLDMGQVAVTKIMVNHQMIGDFTLIMPAGKDFENAGLVEIYSRQIDMFFTRIRDIHALRRSEANLAEAQQIAHLGSWEWDMRLNTVKWSNEMYRVFDMDPGTYDGKPETLLKVIHPEDVQNFTQSLTSNLSSGSSPALEYRVIHRDGSIHHIFASGRVEFDEAGKPVRGLGTVQDITERKKITEALLENEEKYKFLYEWAGVGIGYYTPDGKVISYNRTAAKNMGGKPEDFAGKLLYDLFPAAAADIYLERIRKSAASDEVQEYEEQVELSGESRWFLSTFSRILNSAHQVIGVQIISVDISKRKEVKAALSEPAT